MNRFQSILKYFEVGLAVVSAAKPTIEEFKSGQVAQASSDTIDLALGATIPHANRPRLRSNRHGQPTCESILRLIRSASRNYSREHNYRT